MWEYREEIQRLAEEFSDCRKVLLALGDANRQHLILEMLRMEQCGGVRVGDIAEKTHLSRPAGSWPFADASGRNEELLLL